MDEVDEDRSSRLKRNIFTYFDQQSTTTPDGTTPDGTTESSETGGEMGQLPPVLFKVGYFLLLDHSASTKTAFRMQY